MRSICLPLACLLLSGCGSSPSPARPDAMAAGCGDCDAPPSPADAAVPDAGNPVPSITSLSPNNATRGAPGFTLTVDGAGFVMGAVVQWNGFPRATSFVDASRLTAQISEEDISVAGTQSVTVVNPAPGGGVSNSVPFDVPCVLAEPGPASTQTRARLGAYYFDGWAGPLDSFHLAQLVGGPFDPALEPLYGWRDDNQCAIEQQLAWARQFGLSFFLYDWFWHPETVAPDEDLNSALKIHHSLADRHGMQLAILYVNQGAFAIAPADWSTAIPEWIEYMKDPDYVLEDGKPYFGVIDMLNMRATFGSSSAVVAAFDELRAAAMAEGFPGVYIVGGYGANQGADGIDGLFPHLGMAAADGYDAVSTYVSFYAIPLEIEGEQPWSLLADLDHWLRAQEAARSPVAVIPDVTVGFDVRPTIGPGSDWIPGRAAVWVDRTPAGLASLIDDAISAAEMSPRTRSEPSPAPPTILLGTWNELGDGDYIVPTIGDGTSYGDALAAMLAAPPVRARTVLTFADSGPADPERTVSGTLVDAEGAPIAGATVTIAAAPAQGGAVSQYRISGTPPPTAAYAVVGFRVNSDDPVALWPGWFKAGPAPADVAVYQASYVQPSDGLERVANGDFASGSESWTFAGQAQIAASDQGTGWMAQVTASPAQLAGLDSARFQITSGAPFELSFTARISPSSTASGYFFLAFDDGTPGAFLNIPGESAGALRSESIPFLPGYETLGTATTDPTGSFQLSLASLGATPAVLEVTYAGDGSRWPAYARVGP